MLICVLNAQKHVVLCCEIHVVVGRRSYWAMTARGLHTHTPDAELILTCIHASMGEDRLNDLVLLNIKLAILKHKLPIKY